MSSLQALRQIEDKLQLPQMVCCRGKERKKEQLQGSSAKLPVKELSLLDFESPLLPVKSLRSGNFPCSLIAKLLE